MFNSYEHRYNWVSGDMHPGIAKLLSSTFAKLKPRDFPPSAIPIVSSGEQCTKYVKLETAGGKWSSRAQAVNEAWERRRQVKLKSTGSTWSERNTRKTTLQQRTVQARECIVKQSMGTMWHGREMAVWAKRDHPGGPHYANRILTPGSGWREVFKGATVCQWNWKWQRILKTFLTGHHRWALPRLASQFQITRTTPPPPPQGWISSYRTGGSALTLHHSHTPSTM